VGHAAVAGAGFFSLFGLQHANRQSYVDLCRQRGVRLVRVGTDKPHATMMAFLSSELAKTGTCLKSHRFRLLNGT